MPEPLPLFPLNSVLFPTVPLPLHIFEERYRELVHTLVTQDAAPRRFGVVAIKEGWHVGPDAVTALHGIGCAAQLRRVSRYPDGRYDIVAVGTERFRLAAVDDGAAPYLVGSVEWIAADGPADDESRLLGEHVRTLFGQHLAAVATIQGGEPELPDLPDDPSGLSYRVAANAVLALADRQGLLEIGTPAARLRAELRLLKRETAMLRRLRALPLPLVELQVSQSLS